jgi:hypothetical protein
MSFILPTLPTLPICTGISFLVGIAFTLLKHRKNPDLAKLIAGGATASSIPTGVTLLCCVLNPALLVSLESYGLYAGMGGVALLWIAYKELTSKA